MSSSRITPADALAAFDVVGAGGEPVTASELAEELGCSPEAAAESLAALVERGELRTKAVGESGRVWWRPSGDDSQGRRGSEGTLAQDSHEGPDDDPDLLTRILDASPVGIGIMTPDGTITHVNSRAQTLLGVAHDEDLDTYALAAERAVYDADGEPLAPGERPAARTVEAGEPVYNEELRIETADGDLRWVSMNVEPLFDDDGSVERLVVAGEDITPLKEQAKQLERQRDELEAELDEVFARIDEAFYALDEGWRFTYLNEQAARLLDVDDAHGRVIWNVLPETRDSEMYDALHDAVETQEPVTYEEFFEELDAWLEVHAYPSESGLSVHFRDVTDHRRREQELERYETIVETVNDGIYVKDGNDVFTLVNQTYAEMLGYEPDELVGRDSAFVVSEEVKRAADELYESLRAGDRDTVTIQAPMQGAGDEMIEAEASFALIPKADGTGDERVGVVRDITERKERERRLEQQNQRLESFASMLAHELRNPLSIGQIYLQDARNGDDDAFEEVATAHDRMEEMIDILLILTRGGDSSIDPEPVALREVALESWSELDAADDHLTVETELVLDSEPHHLRHVLENLFQNALEHGDDDVTVRVGALGEGADGFYVEDDGPGIPEADRESVFEAGYTTDAGGIGLGLTFIAQIADAYGWKWRLTESESGGARFEFTSVDVVSTG